MTHPPLGVQALNDVFAPHPVVLKTPSILPPMTLPLPISHSNGYPVSDIKPDSPTNVGGVVVGVPSVFDPLPVGVKEDKSGVIQPLMSEGKLKFY